MHFSEVSVSKAGGPCVFENICSLQHILFEILLILNGLGLPVNYPLMMTVVFSLCVQMRFCVAVFLAVLQLCSLALQSDPQLYISQVENDQEKPSSESNLNNESAQTLYWRIELKI